MSRPIGYIVHDLQQALKEENERCFDADREKLSQIELAIDILMGNKNELIKK